MRYPGLRDALSDAGAESAGEARRGEAGAVSRNGAGSALGAGSRPGRGAMGMLGTLREGEENAVPLESGVLVPQGERFAPGEDECFASGEGGCRASKDGGCRAPREGGC